MRPRWILAAGVLAACVSSGSTGLQIPEGRVALRLTATDGSAVSLAGLRGRPALITVITTWSDHALVEVPLYKELHARYGDRLAIVCVALDEDPRMAEIFARTFEVPYRVATVSDKAGFTGPGGPFGEIGIVPTSVLLDAEGRIAARMDGMWSPEVLERAVAAVVEP